MKLSLGTVQFGLHYGIANQSGQVSLDEVSEILALARDHGIQDLDTAIAYGDAETRLGQMGVQDFRVVTKLPPLPATMPPGVADAGIWAKEQVSASLQRLKCDRLYGLMLHRSTDLLGTSGKVLLQSLQEFQDQGVVRKLGVSIYAPSELDTVMPLGPWGLVQAPFNLVDRRLQSSGWLHRLKDMNVEVHTRSAFLQGALLLPSPALSAKFSPWAPLWKRLYQWQTQTGSSLLGACLGFVQSFPEVDRIVVGVDGPAHLREILAVMEGSIRTDWPDIACDDERLVNPSLWTTL